MNDKIRKVLLSSMSVAAISLLSSTVSLASTENTIMPISAPIITDNTDAAQEQVKASHYASFTGTIQEIADHGQDGAFKLVTVTTADGGINNFVVTDKTYVMDELVVGSEIIAFYDANLPVIMIYPPQYSAIAIANVSNDGSFMADRFDENLISADGSLKLHISDETEVVTQDGEVFEGDFTNRSLFIQYQKVALSYPGQTTPSRVVVLNEKDVIAIPENAEEPTINFIDLNGMENKQWLINGELVTAPSAFIDEQGVMMVPVRALAEALGHELTWEADSKTIRIGRAISLQVGQDNYIFARMAPIQLGTAPALVDGLTYVPVSFFTEVIRAKEIIVDTDQIVIQQ